jgi:hypothetical protein
MAVNLLQRCDFVIKLLQTEAIGLTFLQCLDIVDTLLQI